MGGEACGGVRVGVEEAWSGGGGGGGGGGQRVED